MKNIMEQILTGQLSSLETNSNAIAKYVTEENILELVNILKGIKEDKLYSSQIHGLYHSEKVLLFAYLIAKQQNLNPVDFQIIIDAALYHDIRRENDFEDPFHGYASALKIGEVVDHEIYQDKTNLELLKAIVDLHSQDDKRERQNFELYELDEKEYERYKVLATILKDADGLDRTRFSEKSMATLDPKFLRLDFSKNLISLSKEINLMYYEVIENNMQEHIVDNSKGGSCFHSISFDFFKLNSILTYGVLSASEIKKQHLNVPRNFEGGNSNNWISVVDASLIKHQYTGFKNFTKHGISFLCEVPEMILPVEGSHKAEAIQKGLPFDKSGHLDEKYVYSKIPVENILCTIVPEEYINTDIRSLTYLYNSLDFDLFVSRIKYYIDRFNEEEIAFYDKEVFTKDIFDELLAKYKMEIDKFIESKKTGDDRKLVENNLTILLNELNKYIQNAMYKYYAKVLNKTGNISVLDVVTHEMSKSGIDYNYICGNAEAIFMFNSINKGSNESEKTF